MAVLVISYSRADQPQVRAVVSLLRTALRGIDKAVFWDGDLEPGEAWFTELKSNIDSAPQLFVFWCDHSAGSNQVRQEFAYALERGKRVVPVLIDSTPLCPELAHIHGIDLRGAIAHPWSPPSFAPPRSAFAFTGLLLVAMCVGIVVLMSFAIRGGWSVLQLLGLLVTLILSAWIALTAILLTWHKVLGFLSRDAGKEDDPRGSVTLSPGRIVDEFSAHLFSRGF